MGHGVFGARRSGQGTGSSLTRKSAYDSVPAVAAAPSLKHLKRLLVENPRVERAFRNFVDAAYAAAPYLPAEIAEGMPGIRNPVTANEWLDKSDAGIFHLPSSSNWAVDYQGEEPEPQALKAWEKMA